MQNNVQNQKNAAACPSCQALTDEERALDLLCHEKALMATLTAMQRAISAARAGEGPQWVVANTLRMCGHGEHDDAAYIPAGVKAAYADRDPLAVARRQMLETGWLKEEEAAAWDDECRDEVQRLVAQAQREKEFQHKKAMDEKHNW